MRRLLSSLALATGLLVLGGPAALAGGPTSVLLANHETGRSAAALHGSAAYAEKRKIDAWIFSQVANLVQQLANAVEGAETALDHSVILTANDMEEGASHSVDHIPFALIGSCGGYLKTGQALHLGSEPHNLLLTTLCNAMDIPVTSFGQSYSGNIPQLVA